MKAAVSLPPQKFLNHPRAVEFPTTPFLDTLALINYPTPQGSTPKPMHPNTTFGHVIGDVFIHSSFSGQTFTCPCLS
jgi:hypothetical protein